MDSVEVVSNESVQHGEYPLAVNREKSLSIQSLISQAISNQLPVETMERLLAMAEKLEAKYAKEAFDSAMAMFQAECPTIVKTKAIYTNAGVLAYKYAPIESIVAQVKSLLSTHKFSYAIQTETEEARVTATCIAKHEQGHSESSSFTVPLGTKTALMSNTQQVAAALTFAKRYAFCNAFGILTGDEDTDSKVVESIALITPEQIERLRELLAQTDYDEPYMLKACNIQAIEEMTAAQAASIIAKLEIRLNRS